MTSAEPSQAPYRPKQRTLAPGARLADLASCLNEHWSNLILPWHQSWALGSFEAVLRPLHPGCCSSLAGTGRRGPLHLRHGTFVDGAPASRGYLAVSRVFSPTGHFEQL